MLIYVLGLLVMIGYEFVARRSGGLPLVWPLFGLAAYFGSYWAWRLLLLRVLVRDTETLVWFLLMGMLIGVMVAVVLLGFLVGGAVARKAGRGEAGGQSPPALSPPRLHGGHYALAFGAAMAFAVISVLLQELGAIRNEIGPGGIYLAGLAGAVGGAVLRRPLRGILVGVGLGLVYAACYAPGLNLIGKLPLRGSEALIGALIGLPLLMIVPAAAGCFLGAACARSVDTIRILTRSAPGAG